MWFGIHPPTLELQLTLLRLARQNGERWLELCAGAAGERIAGVLHEGTISLNSNQAGALPDEALASATRQVDDYLGDAGRFSQMALQNQVAFWTGVQQAMLAWQKASMPTVPPTRP